jgi:predicted small lipoprotein YifL
MTPRTVTRAIATMLLGASLAACGGKGEGPAQPAAPSAEEPEGEGEGSKLISDQDLEAVTLYFERKRTVVSRCFTDAMDAGEAGDAKELFLTVTVKVQPGGKATSVRFSDATVRSEGIETCVREHIEKWTLPEVKQAFDYSHRYGFNAL